MNKQECNKNTILNLYFDNAATSWPKPEAVYKAPEIQMRQACGNPGRSGHTRTLEADRLIYLAREAVGQLFNVNNPARIVFTLNATDALNIAIKGILESGDHVLHTAIDHNSVLRPLGKLRRSGMVSVDLVPCDNEGYPDLGFLESAFRKNSRLLIINHASNVTGTIVPLEEMINLAHEHGVKVLVDAAQTAGSITIDAKKLGIDMIAFTGHKGLLGPSGTGGLYVREGIDLDSLREGGTGSQSELDIHPESMPERLEAGTLNSPGLAGLLEGIKFITETGIDRIRKEEIESRSYLYSSLSDINGIKLYGPEESKKCSCLLSFTIDNADSGEVGYILENNYGILCRTGLHCAPLAHQAIGTFPAGTVRLSPGFFTGKDDIDYLAKALQEITSLT